MKKLSEIIRMETMNIQELMAIKGGADNQGTGCQTSGCLNAVTCNASTCTANACSTKACTSNTCKSFSCTTVSSTDGVIANSPPEDYMFCWTLL